VADRYQAIMIHGGVCQCCGRRPTPDNPLHVDHIKPRSKFPELALDTDNLQSLCRKCNIGKSNLDCSDWRFAPDCLPDDDGEEEAA
jgi:5-methylcytosine-specific restriction endonuclease McrA